MTSDPEIEILLATYNGERFLREQIDSIFAQDFQNIRVLARDDGSTDGTIEILNEYAARFPDRFELMPPSKATGSPKCNFLRLMKASTANRICFADQDDIWLPDKLSATKRAMDILEFQWGESIPLLVFTDLRVVDDKLTVIHESFWAHMGINPGRLDRLAEPLVQGSVTGCTAMLNRRLLELALPMPEEATMHDRWIGLLVSGMGKFNFVRVPTVLYRQHDGNVLGIGEVPQARSLLQRFLHPRVACRQFIFAAHSHFVQWKYSQEQAAAFVRLHAAELPQDKLAVVLAYLKCGTSRSRWVRIATFVRYGFYCQGILPNLFSLFHLWNLKVDAHEAA